MHKVLYSVIIASLIAGVCCAETLDGRTIKVTGGEQASVFVPVSIEYTGDVPDKAVQVIDKATGKVCPATVAEGCLTFIVVALAPKQEKMYEVKLVDQAARRVTIMKKDGEDAADIVIQGKPFTTYHYSNDAKKPYLWPVYVEGGETVTRNWPMDPEDKTSTDHVHQKSLWTAYGDINGIDWWGEGDGSGTQHSDEVTFGSGDAYGWIKAKNTWQDKDGNAIIAEDRAYRFYNGPDSLRILDATITFTAKYGDVKFGDTKEGGIMAFRIRPDIQGTRGGVITNAEGLKGEKECWGKPSAWTDYAGKIEGTGIRGIAVFDNPANLRYPTRWHIRNYGLNGANCFGLSYFTEKDPERLNGDYTVKDGESLTFKYRVAIHSGDATEAKIADRHADYLTPPKAEWAK